MCTPKSVCLFNLLLFECFVFVFCSNQEEKRVLSQSKQPLKVTEARVIGNSSCFVSYSVVGLCLSFVNTSPEFVSQSQSQTDWLVSTQ